MPKQKITSSEKRLKIREVRKLFRACENFLRSTSSKNKELIIFVNKLGMILKPYEDLDAERVLRSVRNSLGSVISQTEMKHSLLFNEADVKFLSLDKVKKLVTDRDLDKGTLLLIAEKRLGIPVGTLKKMKKSLVQNRILSVIQNIEKLETIGRRAAE